MLCSNPKTTEATGNARIKLAIIFFEVGFKCPFARKKRIKIKIKLTPINKNIILKK